MEGKGDWTSDNDDDIHKCIALKNQIRKTNNMENSISNERKK